MKPDFTVGLGYMLMPTGSSSRNAYMAELSMNLPWLNRERHDGEAKQADAATDVSQAELDARASTVFLEIRQAQIEVLAAEKRVKLYRDTLLPQAEASFKASTAAYQNNRAEFMSLIDAQNLLLDIQTAYYKASAAADAGMAQLERAIGAPIQPQRTATREEKQMTMKEKKLFAFGVGAGVLKRGSCGWISDSEGDAPCFSGIEYGKPRRFPLGQITPGRATRYSTGYDGRADSGRDYRGGRAGCRGSHSRTEDGHRRVWPREQPEAQLAAVSARIGGRVDKLYVQYTGERVRSGQPVADIYSPEVATAIEEYHLAEENRNQLKQSDDAFARTQADALVKASQHKLELWGISGKQSDAPEKMASLTSPSTPMPLERLSIAR
jgi:hypothetical protein